MKPHTRTTRKRVFLILLGFSVVLVILNSHGLDRHFKKPVVDTLSPILEWTRRTVDEVRQTVWALFNFYKQDKKNQALQRQVDLLEQKWLQSQEMQKENERFLALLNFQSQLDFPTLAARVIGEDPSNLYHSMIINKGVREGIQVNQALLSSEGMVGKIVVAHEKSAQFMLLTDKNSRVGAMIHRSRDRGILKGEGDARCRLHYLPRNAEVNPGDLVTTSGFDRFVPKGILLGEIASVHDDESGLYRTAVVIPAVNFAKLEEVLVMIGAEIRAESAAPSPPGVGSASS